MSQSRIERFFPQKAAAASDLQHAPGWNPSADDACSPGSVQDVIVEGWEEQARTLFNQVAKSIAEKTKHAFKLRELECRVAKLESCINSKPSEIYSTFITTLGINGFDLKKPISVTIRSDGEEVIASFLDANISTGGKTLQEAVSDLQSLIVDSFKGLESAPESTLGPTMTRRKKALLEIVCRIS